MRVPVAPGRLPFLGHTLPMLRGRHRYTARLRERAEIVEVDLGPLPTYFVTSPRFTHQVLVTDGPRFRKGIMFERFEPFLGNGLILSDGAFHRRQRRMVQPAFHRDRLAGYTAIMADAAGRAVGAWRPGEVRVVEDDMQALAVTIVGEALFTTEIEPRAIEEIRRSMFEVTKYGMLMALLPGALAKVPTPPNRRFHRAIGRIQAVVGEVVARRRAEGVDRGDLLSILLQAHDEDTGEGMSDRQVFDEVVGLLSAGIETTALALAWAFHELSRHPDVEERLHAEVDEVLAGRPVTFDDLPKLTYTRQVVQEVLRRYPIWILMRRTLEPVDFDGFEVPAGSEVIISPHALHHDPRTFPDPDRFDPDRWEPSRAASVPRGAYIPFGAGTRQCVGNAFALNEAVVVLATVASKYRLRPVPGKPVRTKYTTAPYPSGLLLTVVPRS
ncbi:cytochrome P450 [Saccharothrix variisporea]|uniref:Cytochrome P450 n=1 Tax=Saccharothrix variisporea TaxID=543527 RepID=A0A495XE41_9PSEU|nr:cytochrome P450 [Saccharothrix variisporea]RKT72721.1 cytochrome P450 [Saccharothrix variisporea]